MDGGGTAAAQVLGEQPLRALGTVTLEPTDGSDSGTGRTFMVAVATRSFERGGEACHLVVYEQGGAKVWMKRDGAGVGEDLKSKGCVDENLSCARILCNGIGFFDGDDDAPGGTHCHRHRHPPIHHHHRPTPNAQRDSPNPTEYDTSIKFRDGDGEMQFRVRKRVSDSEGTFTRKRQLEVKLQLQVDTTSVRPRSSDSPILRACINLADSCPYSHVPRRPLPADDGHPLGGAGRGDSSGAEHG